MSEKLQALCVYEWPIWTKEVCSFDWHYDDLETRLLLEGQVTVRTYRSEVSFGAFDLVTFQKGLSCHWYVKEVVKKHYRFGQVK